MCLLLLYDVEKIGYGTWLTKFHASGGCFQDFFSTRPRCFAVRVCVFFVRPASVCALLCGVLGVQERLRRAFKCLCVCLCVCLCLCLCVTFLRLLFGRLLSLHLRPSSWLEHPSDD